MFTDRKRPLGGGFSHPIRGAAVLALGALSFACGSTQPAPNKHAHSRPLSADEHLAEADRHNRVAAAETAAAANKTSSVETRCYGGDAVESQTRIGTEPVEFMHPCFTSVTHPTSDHLREARENRAEAKRHRQAAAALIEAEGRACGGLDEDAVIHSPFYHREDITDVQPLEENGATVGVTVTFARVRGLTVPWMTAALACHQARAAALGFPRDYMAPHCLSSVRGAEVEVSASDDHVTVVVRGSDGASAATILGRALSLRASLPVASAASAPHEAH